MIRWMSDVKLREKLSCVELMHRLEIQDIVKVVQRNKLQWYRHVLRKIDDDWVKKCVTLEAEGARQRGRPRKTGKDVVDKDIDDLQIKPSDAMDHSK